MSSCNSSLRELTSSANPTTILDDLVQASALAVTILVFAGLASHFDYSDSAAAVDFPTFAVQNLLGYTLNNMTSAGAGAVVGLMTPS